VSSEGKQASASSGSIQDLSIGVPRERILSAIHLIRGHKVMLDADLATLYEVETKVLNQAVRRNIDRFPGDFAFRLSRDEFAILRSQTVTSRWGGRRYPPYAFTEQGVAMLSSVLRSKRAVDVNIEIMRAFVTGRRSASLPEKRSRDRTALPDRARSTSDAAPSFRATHPSSLIPYPCPPASSLYPHPLFIRSTSCVRLT